MKRKLLLILVMCVILCTFFLVGLNRESKYFYYLSATERNDAFVKMFDRDISVKHEYFIDLNENVGDNGAYLINVQTASNAIKAQTV
jgi:hypothetical protein